MILTGSKIAVAVERGDITIDPFEISALNPNSYNYRLAPVLKVMDVPVVDPVAGALHVVEHTIPPEGLVLEPRRLYLGSTWETIGSDRYVPSLIGRSSIGRLGVFVQVSADLGQLGAVHKWTLEVVVAQPVRLYAGMRIGQVSFWEPVGTIAPYSGYYGRFSAPQEANRDLLGVET